MDEFKVNLFKKISRRHNTVGFSQGGWKENIWKHADPIQCKNEGIYIDRCKAIETNNKVMDDKQTTWLHLYKKRSSGQKDNLLSFSEGLLQQLRTLNDNRKARLQFIRTLAGNKRLRPEVISIKPKQRFPQNIWGKSSRQSHTC